MKYIGINKLRVILKGYDTPLEITSINYETRFVEVEDCGRFTSYPFSMVHFVLLD